jgi:phage terminase small subunit
MTAALHPETAKLTGAAAKNPARYRKDYVDPTGPLGDAPAHLSAGAKTVWFEISTYMPAHLLMAADRLSLEGTCELMAEFREDPRAFQSARFSVLMTALGKLGGNPLDRLRLATPKPKEEKADPFSDF